MDWSLGLLTILLIGLISAAFAVAVVGLSDAQPPKAKQPPDFDAIKRQQASRAGREHFDGISKPLDRREAWIAEAVRRLLELWPGMGRERARREMLGALEMAGMVYGDPDYDWSLSAAREFAETYVQDYGEQHGSNS